MTTAMRAPMEIGEVQCLLGLTKRAIRLYEEEGLVAPQRTMQNRRVYDLRDVARLTIVAKLRAAGLSLSDIRCVLKLSDHPAGFVRAAAFATSKLDEQAEELRARLAHVEDAKSSLAAMTIVSAAQR